MLGLDGGDRQQSTDPTAEYSGKQEKSAWNTFVAWDKLLLVFLMLSLLAALAAIFILLTPILNLVLDFMGLHFAGWDEWQVAIMDGDRGLFIGAILGLVALFFAFLARRRMRHDYALYMEAGCPQCREDELVRVRRNRGDRVLSYFGLPVRRYSCRNCTWHGLRLAGFRFDHRKETPEGSEPSRTGEEAAESQGEPDTGASPQMELTTETAADAELPETNDSVAQNPVDNLAEVSPELNETVVNAENEPETGLDSVTDMDETTVVTEIDDDSPPGQEEHLGQTVTAVDENVEIPADQQRKDNSSEAGSESENQDDDFDRLCFDVAMSKK